MKKIRQILTATLLTICCTANAQADFEIETETPCAGNIITFKTSSSFKIAKFDFGDGYDAYLLSGDDNLQHKYKEGGNYAVQMTLMDESGTWSEPTIKPFHVGETPEITLEDNKKSAMISATVSDNNATLSWYQDNNLMDYKGNTLYYTESGTFRVEAANNECKAEATIKVEYKTLDEVDITTIVVLNNIITPNNDGINDKLMIEDVIDYTAPCKVQIFDRKGKLIYTNNAYTNTNGFEGKDDKGNDLLSGTYYYVIKSQGRKGCAGFIDIIR